MIRRRVFAAATCEVQAEDLIELWRVPDEGTAARVQRQLTEEQPPAAAVAASTATAAICQQEVDAHEIEAEGRGRAVDPGEAAERGEEEDDEY